eukprot:5829161-Prymnesium_polylepis.1
MQRGGAGPGHGRIRARPRACMHRDGGVLLLGAGCRAGWPPAAGGARTYAGAAAMARPSLRHGCDERGTRGRREPEAARCTACAAR